MGVLNLTPDSFSDGGRYVTEAASHAQIDRLFNDGAFLLDVGAESTRPGAAAVPAAVQLERIGDAVEYAARKGLVSIDTSDASVAEACLKAGARIVNCVDLSVAAELGALCAAWNADLILMHSRGPMAEQAGYSEYPQTGYADVVREVMAEWRQAADKAYAAGLSRDAIAFDPGLGFAKNAHQSLRLCQEMLSYRALAVPVVIGASRKSFLAGLRPSEQRADQGPTDRIGGSLAVAMHLLHSGADVVRVHDVAETVHAWATWRALQGGLAA
jgi:dihydropteroate synthase